MKKILVIGDTHCRTKYISEYKVMTQSILRIAEQEQPDTIILLGDDIHNHSVAHSIQLNTVLDFIVSLSSISSVTKIVKLIGNHEMITPNSFLRGDHHFGAFKYIDKVTIVDEPMIINNNLFVPYIPKGRFHEAIGDFNLSEVGNVFAHQEFRGAKMGNIQSSSDDVWNESMPLMVSGHVHDKQRVQDNLVYPGSPLCLTFADSLDKTVSIIENGVIRDVPVDCVKYVTTHIDLNHEYTDILKGINYNHRNRVIVKGNISDIKSFRLSKDFKSLQKNGIAVVPRPDIEYTKNNNIKKKTFNEIMSEVVTDDLKELWNEIRD